MLTLIIITCLLVSIILNIVSSCYVCYNVAIDIKQPKSTLITVFGIVFLNTLFPYFLGCLTGLWYFNA